MYYMKSAAMRGLYKCNPICMPTTPIKLTTQIKPITPARVMNLSINKTKCITMFLKVCLQIPMVFQQKRFEHLGVDQEQLCVWRRAVHLQ